MKMMDDGVMKGEYYVGDNLNYEIWGEWDLESSDYIYMKIDQYIDGVFHIRSNGEGRYTLYCEKNYVDFYNIGTSKMLMELKRN